MALSIDQALGIHAQALILRSQRAQVLADVLELLRPSLCDTHGKWTADYVRLRVLARAV